MEGGGRGRDFEMEGIVVGEEGEGLLYCGRYECLTRFISNATDEEKERKNVKKNVQ